MQQLLVPDLCCVQLVVLTAAAVVAAAALDSALLVVPACACARGCCRKCKLYRYEASSNEWKERGLGVVKLLKHKENSKIRLLMRQEKTLKIRANHIGATAAECAVSTVGCSLAATSKTQQQCAPMPGVTSSGAHYAAGAGGCADMRAACAFSAGAARCVPMYLVVCWPLLGKPAQPGMCIGTGQA
jgi:hypothetical protein